jgi:hypothetical protein
MAGCRFLSYILCASQIGFYLVTGSFYTLHDSIHSQQTHVLIIPRQRNPLGRSESGRERPGRGWIAPLWLEVIYGRCESSSDPLMATQEWSIFCDESLVLCAI